LKLREKKIKSGFAIKQELPIKEKVGDSNLLTKGLNLKVLQFYILTQKEKLLIDGVPFVSMIF